jgi:MFS transporter, OFA family, oxalate/formate antiporter
MSSLAAPAATAETNEFRRGWSVLLAGFLGTMCGASPLPFNVLGLLFKPLNDEFGWDRAEVSIGITVFGITASLLAPLFGWFADRYGVRRVAIWSLIGFVLAFSSLYFTPPQLIGFYALWFLVGLVGIGSTPVTWSRGISLWFVRQRGLALGLMLVGTSAAAYTVPKIANWTIENFGWREVFPVVALLPLLIALPVTLLLFREPRPEERPASLTGMSGGVAGMTFKEAIRTRQFWLLWLSIFLIATAYGGAHIHIPSIVADHGMSPAGGAAILGIVGIGLLVGRVGVGFMLDHFWGPAVAFPVLCLPAVACYLLLGTDSSVQTINIAAFLLGFAAGAESDLIAFLAARYFGMAHFGRIYGMLYLPFGFMSAVSPVIYGVVREKSGSYDPILMVAAAVFIIGGALLLGLGKYPARNIKDG